MNRRHRYGDYPYGSGTMTDCDTTPTATDTFATSFATSFATPSATSSATSSAAPVKAIGTDPPEVTSTKVGTVSPKVAGALIGVGIVAFFALLFLGFMCWRKRRAAKASTVVASKYDGDGQDHRNFSNRESMEYGIVDSKFVEKPRPVYWK